MSDLTIAIISLVFGTFCGIKVGDGDSCASGIFGGVFAALAVILLKVIF